MGKKKIAILGPKGTNGHEAAQNYFHPDDEELIFCKRNADIFSACIELRCVGVVPIENSTAGLVREVVNFWRKNIESELPIRVIGEIRISIRHSLLAHPNCSGLKMVNAVKSHPQALEQCSEIIAEHGWRALPALSTAAAAREVMETASAEVAAIASPFAGEVYGLKVLKNNGHNCATNETRFHIIGTEHSLPSGNDKTAVIFELKDIPGALAKITTLFWTYGVNLSSIISIPTGKLGVYAFYAEFDCHQKSEVGAEIIARMNWLCEQMLVLGSYLKA
ncbi:MAG: prephenate dehydratase domain-containing protein [Candidatus Paceibacterota bacterium]